jgi:thioredoxin 1
MNEMMQIDESSFQTQVIEAPQPVLVEFGAVWCAPCKRLEPILHTLANEWTGKMRLGKVDVDASTDLVMQYQVMSVPTLILFKGGQAVERLTGLQSREKIVDKFESYL